MSDFELVKLTPEQLADYVWVPIGDSRTRPTHYKRPIPPTDDPCDEWEPFVREWQRGKAWRDLKERLQRIRERHD